MSFDFDFERLLSELGDEQTVDTRLRSFLIGSLRDAETCGDVKRAPFLKLTLRDVDDRIALRALRIARLLDDGPDGLPALASIG